MAVSLIWLLAWRLQYPYNSMSFVGCQEAGAMDKSWKSYSSGDFYDELISPSGQPRRVASRMVKMLQKLSPQDMAARRTSAELAIRDMGISFTVYTEGGNIDRAWPFDIIPRVISAREWSRVSRGLQQRSRALNCFIDDIYNKQKILADGLLPAEIVLDSPNYKPQCQGMSPRYGAWAHVCGTDLVRNGDGRFYVLEDNLRVPSGVSYMVENREITKRVLPELFENHSVLPVDDYPSRLYETLASLSPRQNKRPCVVATILDTSVNDDDKDPFLFKIVARRIIMQ